ncbi:thioredoxin domain-containing protein 9-like [Mya arenaria]|uniref:thioredoxin domain-containing protein 9-like n=1 Tax=Mya arenaria TaxID=6604 RepID=UPI0022E7B4C2|nr:thioredoxin domain-containing protein 9-like [Mya arenaria]
MNPGGMEKMLEGQLLEASKVVEQQLDAEIDRLEKMDEDDFDMLRKQRMDALKKSQQQKQEWMSNGHGKYTEVADEKDFFDSCKKSKKVVCHFYRDSTFRCKIIDKHLEILAPKHIETKFIKIDAEKCKFLVDRLRIVVLPTICIAMDGKTQDYIVGFDDLGGKDEFPTEMLEWRLGRAKAINYQGDVLNPPKFANQKDTSVFGFVKTKKTIKDGRNNDDSSDEDW